jgi:hypothetical protein
MSTDDHEGDPLIELGKIIGRPDPTLEPNHSAELDLDPMNTHVILCRLFGPDWEGELLHCASIKPSDLPLKD